MSYMNSSPGGADFVVTCPRCDEKLTYVTFEDSKKEGKGKKLGKGVASFYCWEKGDKQFYWSETDTLFLYGDSEIDPDEKGDKDKELLASGSYDGNEDVSVLFFCPECNKLLTDDLGDLWHLFARGELTSDFRRAKFMEVTAKCSDCCSVALLDGDGNEILSRDGYVPKFVPGGKEGYGDYVSLKIDLDTGQIMDWKPNREEIQENWIDD